MGAPPPGMAKRSASSAAVCFFFSMIQLFFLVTSIGGQKVLFLSFQAHFLPGDFLQHIHSSTSNVRGCFRSSPAACELAQLLCTRARKPTGALSF